MPTAVGQEQLEVPQVQVPGDGSPVVVAEQPVDVVGLDVADVDISQQGECLPEEDLVGLDAVSGHAPSHEVPRVLLYGIAQ